MNKMFRLILKTVLILVCLNANANANAEPEAIDAAIDAGIESVESLATEAVEDVLFEDADAIVDEDLDEELIAEEEFQAEAEMILTKDVVLVLDNSGSMKKNDPEFLVSKAVKEFISQQDEHTRVGIVIFDQEVRLPVALTTSSLANRETILNSIEEINYKGLFTDSPAGIERAIYELKNNGRDSAQKSIIFMTDGIVDTGAPDRDLEKSKWLREDLAPDAADNEIKIFGIAFTEGADFQLIQSIAQKTEGEYYRALTAADLQNVFEQIDKIINTPPEPEVVQVAPVIEAPAPVIQQAPAPPPVIIEVPAQSMGQEERIRSMIMIAAAIVLTITLLGILIILLRRNRDLKTDAAETVQEGYINDLQGKTDKQTHKLGSKPVMFGRVAGKDTEHLDYIVVNETTIGRRHALIEYKDYSFWIIDQGSINGTFVNGKAVSSEVRLKHGDRIRLHKCDFEFIMPEMEDSGMTVISNTVFAEQPEPIMDESEEATQIKGHESTGDSSEDEISTVSSSDMDFDLTGPDSVDELSDLYEPDPDDEDTIIREVPIDTGSKNEPEFTLDAETDEFDSEDETIMLDDGDADESHGELDDDATLRKDEH
jgi:pSer/pThr/pTyr-binding forkhead associated (FHA) protein/Mg-chelatase subunit ChlD